MSTLEIIFKLTEIIISLFGLVLVVFGWIIPYRNSLKTEKCRLESEKELERMKWKKDLIEKQISVLYAPLNQLCLEGDISFTRILYQLGRQHVFEGEKTSFEDLTEDEQKIWKHYVDTYKIPSQMEMVKILRHNSHLLYKAETPYCIKQFLDYALGWELLDNQKRNNVKNYYEYHYAYNFPHEFKQYIRNTLDTLYAEQQELNRKADTLTKKMS